MFKLISVFVVLSIAVSEASRAKRELMRPADKPLIAHNAEYLFMENVFKAFDASNVIKGNNFYKSFVDAYDKAPLSPSQRGEFQTLRHWSQVVTF